MSRSATCRRVRQELLERFRLGELILADSAEHLDHLRRCPTCHDEVAAERGIVILLRRALAERVGDATPPPDAWLSVIRTAQQPEARALRGLGWWASLVGRMRVATAIAGTGLALVLAINPTPAPPASVPVSPAATMVASGGAGETVGAELLGLQAERPRTAAARSERVLVGPAPSDDMPPAQLRVEVFGGGQDEPQPRTIQPFEPEQVPVLQQPYRPAPGAAAAPAGDNVQPDPAEPEPSDPDPELTNMRD